MAMLVYRRVTPSWFLKHPNGHPCLKEFWTFSIAWNLQVLWVFLLQLPVPWKCRGNRSPFKRLVLGGSSQDLDTWLITMVIVSPLNGVMGPLINGRTSWLINGGDPNYLLSGMILQVGGIRSPKLPLSLSPYSQKPL